MKGSVVMEEGEPFFSLFLKIHSLLYVYTLDTTSTTNYWQ